MSLSDGLKLASNTFEFGMYGLKTFGDLRRHKGHESHHQLCDCMGYCMGCIWETAMHSAKGKANARG